MSLVPRSLFARLAWSLAAVLTLAMLGMGYLLLDESRQRFEQERHRLAVASARVLAEAGVDALAARDYELLNRWVHSVMPTDDMAWVYLDRANGQILSHTDLDQVGRYAEALGALPQPLTRLRRDARGEPVFEAVHPVWLGERHLANAHVAYYPGRVVFFSSLAFDKLVVMLAVALLFMLLATLLIVRRHLHPLGRLAEQVEHLSLDALNLKLAPALLQRNDEVGALARAFDALARRITRLVSELRDEEQRLQATVAERTRALQHSNRELESFCYSVSHDLRAPLRAMDGFSQALLEDHGEKLDEEGRHYLQRIRAAAERMGQLIDDLLRLSRISRQALQVEPLDLVPLARRIFDELQAGEPGRQVTLRLPESLPASGDARLLRIALENLLANAWKYTSRREAAEIALGAETEAGETVYWIRDNGEGFDMTYADKLFHAFQRLHHQDEFPGTGIGLVTVSRIVQRHGGRIWADAEPGLGAIFFFTLGRSASTSSLPQIPNR